MEFNVERLFSALYNLKQSVARARLKLEANCPEDALLRERITKYEEIVKKQTDLAVTLRQHLRTNNTYEIARHIHLITSLTIFIYDDAHELSASLATDSVDMSGFEEERVLN